MISLRARRARAALLRLRRRLGFERNPLRRGVDRRQRAVGIGAVAVFAAVAAPACACAASIAYAAGIRAERAEAAGHHRVTARVAGIEKQDDGEQRYTYARLAWNAPDGREHSAVIAAGRTARLGAALRIWVDARGEMSRRPQDRTDTVAGAVFAGAGAAGGAALPPLAVYLLVRRRCDRDREEMWDAAWARLDRPHIG
ncbi:hypothetical protein GCM10009527_050540 [Actinomadura nitritigenes]|uniref:DUF3592 domain-containing protein n=1 Tax=Actinomadura nitritigenes TaxID=134602 RepID=A0ABS3R4M5_9ACTN|nr:hypothetical protein [Actinomadura nitritigenes]MBO2441184.1 hypothetical protein [Actinomadura nitritigenes]